MQIKLNWIFLRIIPPHLKTINMKSDRVNVNCMFSILCTNHIHSCVCHVLKLLNLQRNDKHCIYCLWSRCLVFRSETENVWGIKPVRKVHLRFSIIQFLLVILVLMAFFFLVRSLVNLTLVSESLNKDRKYSGSFYQLEKKIWQEQHISVQNAIISLYMPCIPIYLNYNLVNYYYYYYLLLVLFYMTLLKHLQHY